MRELLFKNLTSINPRKKDIVLREIVERDGVKAQTERRCFYFIKSVENVKGQEDLQKWLSKQGASPEMSKRHFHIFKEHSDCTGEDKVICKIAGTFYAVADKRVYTIAFLHSFKARFFKSLIG